MTPDDTGGITPALQADQLGRRYGHVWALRESLEKWLRDAENAGLSDDAVTALIAVARHDVNKERV